MERSCRSEPRRVHRTVQHHGSNHLAGGHAADLEGGQQQRRRGGYRLAAVSRLDRQGNRAPQLLPGRRIRRRRPEWLARRRDRHGPGNGRGRCGRACHFRGPDDRRHAHGLPALRLLGWSHPGRGDTSGGYYLRWHLLATDRGYPQHPRQDQLPGGTVAPRNRFRPLRRICGRGLLHG